MLHGVPSNAGVPAYAGVPANAGSLTMLAEQLISNGARFKPAFAERGKKQTMIDIQRISTHGSIRLSRLRPLN
jgi:hypothetical protein